jgi:hypothetical protein
MTEWKFKICCCLLIKRSLKNELKRATIARDLACHEISPFGVSKLTKLRRVGRIEQLYSLRICDLDIFFTV